MAQPVPDREQARQLLAQVFGPEKTFSILESNHGWVCREMSAQASTSRQQMPTLGRGSFVINKHTGVITAHSSMGMTSIGEEFDQTTEAGLPPQGYQIYPKQRRIHLTRISEEPNTIVYRVDLTFLEAPDDPGITQEVEITKNPIRHQPTDRVSAVVTSWASMKSRTTGTWPAEGTIEE
ncbi:hypothetical protein [Nocardia rosealba]|uniref:hypothetical protein n=1 Tax=Nocardia rosealba TaxID=2878563 RepID=UPI001CD9CE7C|nr:hypothetical protein [Nocardia rosealba]MCA2210140.1 hypothetical protein [Nocardia rosealba]